MMMSDLKENYKKMNKIMIVLRKAAHLFSYYLFVRICIEFWKRK